jgi:hypothetical protein
LQVVVIEWLAFLLQVPGSNFSPETIYPDSDFLWLFLVPAGNMRIIT